MNSTLLAISLVLPLVVGFLHLFLRPGEGKEKKPSKWHAPLGAILHSIVGLYLIVLAKLSLLQGSSFQFHLGPWTLGGSQFEWSPTFYLDARNAAWVLLLAIVFPLAFIWLRDKENRYFYGYYLASFMLCFSLLGVFLSGTLITLYVFWELALVAAYFWIGLNGKATEHATLYGALMRFVLITLVGSLPMLLSLITMCVVAHGDVGLFQIAQVLSENQVNQNARWWIFSGFLIGFAVKLPLFGFHGWMRDTYAVAPPTARVAISAAMSKMGAYGLIFVLGMGFAPEMAMAKWPLLTLALIGAVYGGFLCLSSDRLRDIITYSSLSHLGLLALGIFAGSASGIESASTSTAWTGAIFQVFNHGLIVAVLFALDARILSNGQSPALSASGALRANQYRLSLLLLFAIFASLSLPGLSNFAGEILVYFGAFQVNAWLVFVGGLGAFLTAAALIRAYHQVFLGKAQLPLEQAKDLTIRETTLGVMLCLIWLGLGLWPKFFIQPVDRAVNTMIKASKEMTPSNYFPGAGAP